MKIILFGSTGMLGAYVYKFFSQKYEIIQINRDLFDAEKNNFDYLLNLLKEYELSNNDLIINCLGILPNLESLQKYNNNFFPIIFKKFILVNSIFPHNLEKISFIYKCKVINISTDAVFQGDKKTYNENDDPDCDSIYGISKLLGETTNTTIRTTIIGEEVFNKKNFLEFVKLNKDSSINGYENYHINGITCLEFCKVINQIIDKNLFWKGVRHIFSPTSFSKYELAKYINEIYNLNIKINKILLEKNINFVLESNYNLNIEINDIEKQIYEQKEFKLIDNGIYNNLSKCRFCRNEDFKQIFSLKDIPLAGGFIRNKKSYIYEKLYPMTFLFCNKCKTGMIKEIISPNKLFTDINKDSYFYYSSSIKSVKLVNENLFNYIDKKFGKNNLKLLEIGCNDGVLLNNFENSKYNYKLIGIDPSGTIKNITNTNIITYNDFFNETNSDKILKNHGKMDIIVSCNCFAHIDDMYKIYESVKKILDVNGYLIIEVHYLKKIIDELNFDFIYHEHFSYYSINTFIKICSIFNFYLENIEIIPNYGGSLRATLKNNINNTESLYNPSLEKLIKNEENILLDINNLFGKIFDWKHIIYNKIIEIKKNNKLIGYGASGRTNTILSFIDVNFDYIIDDSINKINCYLPKYHTQIVGKEILKKNNIKYVFIFAWVYISPIIKNNLDFIKNGGIFIKILPKVEEISFNNFLNYI